MSHHRRASARAGVLGASPWLRAPLLLLRRPAVFLAIIAATAVLAIAAASGALFLSTLGTAALQAQSAGDCPEFSMPAFSSVLPTEQLARSNPIGLATMTAAGALGTPYVVDVGHATVQTVPVNLYSRAGALDHVRKLTPDTGAPGVWIPDNFIPQFQTRVGATLRTTSGHAIRVAGVYRSLSPSPFQLANLPRYWCTWTDLILRRLAEHGTGPLLIADAKTVAAASDDVVAVSWYDPIPPASTSLERAVEAQRRSVSAAEAADTQLVTPTEIAPNLDEKIATARHSQAGVSGSILPIDLAGVLVAMLLVAGAGAFWATQRAREIRLLVARGVAPGQLAIKAVLETLPATIVGLAGGFFGALALVRSVAPTSVISAGAPQRALLAAAAAVVVSLLLIGLIGALAARDTVLGARRSWLRFVPWELAPLALAIALGLRIRAGSGIAVDHTVVRVKPLLFVFPLIGSAAVLLLLGRFVGAWLPHVGRRSADAGAARYLALHRIAGSRAVVVALIVGTALPCGLLTYATTVTTGVRQEITKKYQTNLGAENVLDVIGIKNSTPRLDGHGTAVVSYQTGGHLADGSFTYVLGVDPATFAKFAFTTPAQRAAVGKLRPVTGGSAVPAILVNAPRGTDASPLSIRATAVHLDVVAHSQVFPGERDGAYPMVVLDRSALAKVDPQADRTNQIWTTDQQLASAEAIIARDGYTVLSAVEPQVVVSTTGLLPLTWIFGYLRALAVMIGLVAIVGLIFALAARTRRRTVSYVLSRRMGMSKGTHLRSLLIELALVLGFGWLAGAGVGSAAYGLIFRSLDVYPALPPPASFVFAQRILLVTAAVLAIVVAVASVATQALAERANPADVLRLE